MEFKISPDIHPSVTLMSDFQDLTRSLLAAGSVGDPEGEGEYLLYVDPQRSFLSCRHWEGNAFGETELIAPSVRPNSTAAYLITETGKFVICITPSSNLSAYEYDGQWDEIDDHPIMSYEVHSDGRLAASIGANGRIYVFFQDPSQRLICLDDAYTATVIPVNPVVGSPFSTALFNDKLHLFYISANDNYIHDVTQEDSTWKDRVVINYEFKTEIKSFFTTEDEKGEDLAYVLTGDSENALVKITGGGEMTKLGTVKDSTFVPQTPEQARIVVSYYRGGQLVKRIEATGARVRWREWR